MEFGRAQVLSWLMRRIAFLATGVGFGFWARKGYGWRFRFDALPEPRLGWGGGGCPASPSVPEIFKTETDTEILSRAGTGLRLEGHLSFSRSLESAGPGFGSES